MLRIRESRAFTMIELIVVIVILGILAAMAAVSYNAVINRSKKAAAEQTAAQVDKELVALAAFANTSAGQLTTAQVSDVDADFEGSLAFTAQAAGADTKLGTADDVAGKVVITAKDSSLVGTLTLGKVAGERGSFAYGV